MAKDLFGIVGTAIAGTYEVEAVVAEGGFAIVYRAHHTGFGAKVALKCLKLSRKVGPERQAEFLAQFKAEAALLFQLSSSIPTVVRPLHIDALTTKDGTFVPYMVLEWLEGETLAAIIHSRAADGLPPPPLKKLVRLMGPVAQALARAHEFTAADGTAVSIVHQDIKPENIFVASVAGEQVVKILDFGVAKAQSVATQVAGSSGSERSGVHSFTPAYAAPEQWAPDKYGETGPWTDVWGLALTLVEAMAGRLIIDGDVHTMMNIILDPIARPTPANNDVDVTPEVEAVFEHALALDPKDRPPNVGQFWDELLIALGMKEGHRDKRREGGGVLREERVEVPKAKPAPKAAQPGQQALAKIQLRQAPKAPLALPKHRLTIDDPFELDDPPSPFGGVEVAKPAAPPRPGNPARKMSLELSLPDLPPEAIAAVPAPRRSAGSAAEPAPLVELEAAIPFGAAAARALEPRGRDTFHDPEPSITASSGERGRLELVLPATSAGMELEVPRAPPPKRPPSMELEAPVAPRRVEHAIDPVLSRHALDVEAENRGSSPGLEASLRPEPRQRAANVGSEIELGGDVSGFRVDLRSELPPRGQVAPAPRTPQRAPRAAPRTEPDQEPPKRRINLLVIGVVAIVLAIGIALADRSMRAEDGSSTLTLGPVSPIVIAGVLFALGVGVLIYQFLPHDER